MKLLCEAMWDDCKVKWLENPTINSVGGLLCLWRKSVFELNSYLMDDGIFGMTWIWKEVGCEVIFVSVYISCDLNKKKKIVGRIKKK